MTVRQLEMELEDAEYEVAYLQCDKERLTEEKLCLQEEVVNLQTQLQELHYVCHSTYLTSTRYHSMSFTATSLEHDDLKTTFYTGLPSYAVFKTLYATLQPYIKTQLVSKCCLEDQFLLVLAKLRLGLSNRDLAYRMNIDEPSVSIIFHNWLDLMYREMKQFIIWPDPFVLRENLPSVFKG